MNISDPARSDLMPEGAEAHMERAADQALARGAAVVVAHAAGASVSLSVDELDGYGAQRTWVWSLAPNSFVPPRPFSGFEPGRGT